MICIKVTFQDICSPPLRNFPAKNTIYTPHLHVCMVLANPTCVLNKDLTVTYNFWASVDPLWKFPAVRSYTGYMYNYGQPYTYGHLGVKAWTSSCTEMNALYVPST